MELYISDLDGTLLTNQQEISRYSLEMINRLIDEGLCFSIATARSIESAAKIIEGLHLPVPIVVHNGVFVYDRKTDTNIREALLDKSIAREIISQLNQSNISPFVFTIDSKQRKKIHFKDLYHEGEHQYYQNRVNNGDKRFHRVDSFEECLEEKIITVVSIGDSCRLQPLYELFRMTYDIHLNFAEDIYSGAYWLEATDKYANKKEGVRFVKDYVGADRLICFGDHLNDCPMFDLADEKYAVSNATEFLKQMATGVIGSNEENAVADYLKTVWQERKS